LSKPPRLINNSTPLPKKSKKKQSQILYIKQKETAELTDASNYHINNSYSKSSLKLIKLFGNQPFIDKFDKARKLLKSNPGSGNHETYLTELAKVEVKTKNLEFELSSKLEKIERENLAENDDIIVIPNLQNVKQYDNIISSLKCINLLKAELKF